MRKDEWRGLLVFILVVVTAMIVGVLVIDRICSPKKEDFKLGPTGQKEIPEEVKVVMGRIQEKNVAIKNIMDKIPAKNPVFMTVNVLYMKALREGMNNGRDAYLDGKIGEEKLFDQMKKAEGLMNEALEKAEKALKELKTAPHDAPRSFTKGRGAGRF